MPKINIQGYLCLRCTHKWVPRENKKKPTVCPKCKTPYWDTLKKNATK